MKARKRPERLRHAKTESRAAATILLVGVMIDPNRRKQFDHLPHHWARSTS